MTSAINGLFIGKGVLFTIVLLSFMTGFVFSSMFGIKTYDELTSEVYHLRKENQRLLKERKVRWINHE